MSSEWSRLTLKNAGVILIDCDHRTPAAASDGYPYIAIPQLKNGHIVLDGVRRISQSDYNDWTRKLKPQVNDVIVVRRCSSGDSAHVPAGLDCAIGQNLVILRANGEHVVPIFLRWLLKGPEWWGQVSKFINVGAVFDSLRCRDIPNFELTIPPLDQQIEIASILGAIDDRITLLRETNTTLEAMAQALFKSWFVDFDPVLAKSEGVMPEGMDAATAALFPDSFEESEQGMVPRGWKVCSILDIANLLSGGTPKTDRAEYWGGNIPWASAKDVSQAADIILTGTDRTITDLGLQKSSTRMIPAFSTVVVARGATTGRMVMFGMTMAMNQTCYALDSKAGTPVALYLMLKKEIDSLTQKAHGSVFDTITTSTFSASKTLQIPDTLLVRFESVAGPLFRRVFTGCQQVNILTQLRDTLLPRLVSGQLRLTDAKVTVENALSGSI